MVSEWICTSLIRVEVALILTVGDGATEVQVEEDSWLLNNATCTDLAAWIDQVESFTGATSKILQEYLDGGAETPGRIVFIRQPR